jgi:hypothetical protein
VKALQFEFLWDDFIVLGDVLDDDLGDVEFYEVVLLFDNAAGVGYPVVVIPCIQRSIILNDLLILILILNNLPQRLDNHLLQVRRYLALIICVLQNIN